MTLVNGTGLPKSTQWSTAAPRVRTVLHVPFLRYVDTEDLKQCDLDAKEDHRINNIYPKYEF